MEIEGGIIDLLIAGVVLGGAIYGADYACRQAYLYVSLKIINYLNDLVPISSRIEFYLKR